MKKFVIVLLIFTFLVTFGAVFDSQGNIKSADQIVGGALDVLLFVPNKVRKVAEKFTGMNLNGPVQQAPTSDEPYDLLLKFKKEGKNHVVYLRYQSYESGSFSFGLPLGLKHVPSVFTFLIVNNSVDPLWNNHTMKIHAGYTWPFRFKKVFYAEEMFPNGEEYEIDMTVTLPYELIGG